MRHFDLHDTYVDAYCDQKYAVAASSRSLLLKCLLHCCWLAGTRLISLVPASVLGQPCGAYGTHH